MSTHKIGFGSWMVGEAPTKPERFLPKYKTSFGFDGNLESNIEIEIPFFDEEPTVSAYVVHADEVRSECD